LVRGVRNADSDAQVREAIAAALRRIQRTFTDEAADAAATRRPHFVVRKMHTSRPLVVQRDPAQLRVCVDTSVAHVSNEGGRRISVTSTDDGWARAVGSAFARAYESVGLSTRLAV
jgi:hypothetical protein